MAATMIRCRPDNPGCWLAVTAIARLAGKAGTLVIPRWRQDGAELALPPERIRGAVMAVQTSIAQMSTPWGPAGPVTLDIAGRLLCLDWHCKPERQITGRSQLRLVAGQVTVPRQLAACAELVNADRMASEDWLDAAPDEGTWLLDAAGAWDRATLGYSPDALGIAVAGNAMVELMAMIGAALAPWTIDVDHFRYEIDGQPLWAPFVGRGRLRALGWARPDQPHQEEASDDEQAD